MEEGLAERGELVPNGLAWHAAGWYRYIFVYTLCEVDREEEERYCTGQKGMALYGSSLVEKKTGSVRSCLRQEGVRWVEGNFGGFGMR